MIKFLIGFILGFTVGYITLVLMIASKEEEEWNEYMNDDDR